MDAMINQRRACEGVLLPHCQTAFSSVQINVKDVLGMLAERISVAAHCGQNSANYNFDQSPVDASLSCSAQRKTIVERGEQAT